jgi:hypothetical protein
VLLKFNWKVFKEEGEEKMQISETVRLQQPRVLTGLFTGGKTIYQAQEVLTDFGYPKDAARVIEVDGKWEEFKTHGKHALSLIRHRFLTGILIGAAVAIVGGVVSQSRFFSMMSFFEGALLLIAWAIFAIIATLICSFLGTLLMTVIYSYFAEEYEDSHETSGESVLISVSVRTPLDAEDIAREWEEIGGKVI